ncbi:DHHA2 [Macleaya cordata]|uniref:DHHA2 n=1 Tax=Macleaya cordata TaxID=56857 RepID=A0A200QWY5_MACCD|nr:DHHA2 [Macleaya cordata]
MRNDDLPNSIMDNYQERYFRKRENPFFYGIGRSNSDLIAGAPTFDLQGSVGNQNSADVSEPKLIFEDLSDEISETSTVNLASITQEIYGLSLSGRNSKFGTAPSFSSVSVASVSETDLDEGNDLVKESILRAYVANEGSYTIPAAVKPTVQRTYSLNKSKSDLSKIPLPQSAASFYSGNLPPRVEIVESCESIDRLNQYLKDKRDFIRAGVPGMFLHAVMGQEATDVGSVASTIMYAFYLNETLKSIQLCTVPIINMKRADLSSHAELIWLLDSCHIDIASLIFIDEIDLSYYYVFGSLKLVLLNGHKLQTKNESLKEAVVEIFNCKKDDSTYSWVETVTTGQDCSCCTLVAEKFSLASPEMLVGQGFSRLLLAGILLDTGNLKNSRCTSKDKYMATLLINGAGRFGCNGLYQILRYKMYDISELKIGDILRKDFKKWTRVGKPENAASRLMVSHIGMSSIGISVGQLLSHKDSASQDIILFQQSEKLRLLMIVSGYYDAQKNFKREILVSAESPELMRNLLHFFNSNSSQLPLKVLHKPGLREELKAFEIDNKITSRKTIERLLEEFGGTSRR